MSALQLNWSSFIRPYTEAVVNAQVNSVGGIYMLWGLCENTQRGRYWECFYVGKSDDLKRRLMEHLSDAEPNECIKGKLRYATGFHVAGVGTEVQRSGVEKALYDHFRPACNDRDPGGAAIQVIIPADRDGAGLPT